MNIAKTQNRTEEWDWVCFEVLFLDMGRPWVVCFLTTEYTECSEMVAVMLRPSLCEYFSYGTVAVDY